MTITLDGLLLYCGALVVLFLTPGPVWVAIDRAGVCRAASAPPGRSAVGVTIGDLVWPLAAIFGLSWILSVYAGFMEVLRWVAVAIFVLMGWLLIRHADRPITQDSRLTRPGTLGGLCRGRGGDHRQPQGDPVLHGRAARVLRPADASPPRISRSSLPSRWPIPMTGNLMFALMIDRVGACCPHPGRCAA